MILSGFEARNNWVITGVDVDTDRIIVSFGISMFVVVLTSVQFNPVAPQICHNSLEKLITISQIGVNNIRMFQRFWGIQVSEGSTLSNVNPGRHGETSDGAPCHDP
jgi:hypothetical protein